MRNRRDRLSLSLALALLAAPAIAQDCDSDGIPDAARLGPGPSDLFGAGLDLTPDDRASGMTGMGLANQSFTVEMWIYRGGPTGDAQFALFSGAELPNQGLTIGFRADDRFTFAFWANDLDTTQPFPPDGQWHHWACVYDVTTVQRVIYLDGVLIENDTSAPLAYSAPLLLGGLVGRQGFNGIIDDLRIWTTARTQGEIIAAMDSPIDPSTPGLLASYRFDSIGPNGRLDDDTPSQLDLLAAAGQYELVQYERDCNDNGIPDSCDLLSGLSRDCNGNGILDECDIQSGFSQDCNWNGVPDDCDIAAGASLDCNGNGVPDECDIATNFSQDCNWNGRPDECDIADGILPDCNGNGIADRCDPEPDCNGNGSPDACDLASGLSQDLNFNGIPDECDPDCDGDGIPDFVEIQNGGDQNNNGVPDDCDPDCDGNGIPDFIEIQQGGDVNGNGVPDNCENIFNATQGTYWGTLQLAADAARFYDEIIIAPGDYAPAVFLVPVTLTGIDPEDPATVAATYVRNINVSFWGFTVRGVRLGGITADGIVLIDRCVAFDPTVGSWIRLASYDTVVTVINSHVHGFNTVANLTLLDFPTGSDPRVELVQSTFTGATNAIIETFGLWGQGTAIIANSVVIASGSLVQSNITSINVRVRNSVVEGAISLPLSTQAEIAHTIYPGSGGDPANNVLDIDPMFIDPDGPDDNPQTFADNDFGPLPGSPMIDLGLLEFLGSDRGDMDDDGDTNEPLPLDLVRNPRIVGSAVDIGPVEYQGPPPCPADLAPPVGVLNFFDVAAFIALYNDASPAADLAAPFGVLNFFDVAEYVALYNAGCP